MMNICIFISLYDYIFVYFEITRFASTLQVKYSQALNNNFHWFSVSTDFSAVQQYVKKSDKLSF